MGMLDFVQKIGDIVIEPIRVLSDYAREPLRGSQHRRDMEREVHAANTESERRLRESSHAADIEAERLMLEAELEIKRKTEIRRILTEIDELKKDKEFARMKAVSDAIMQYQERLTRLNVNAIRAIGSMQLDLREKAQNLVYEKTIKYKELQDNAHAQAMQEMIAIERNFGDNEAAKAILYNSVDKRLASIISTAQNFLQELSNDIAVLNKSINLLAENGQSFVEDHLKNFHVVTNGSLLPGAEPSPANRLSNDGRN
ncbi:hypothetical protein [Burkholderia multivorans]|uniref:hypothetical protein n=1 Tax=Burkholderia multivorans TaxID=87883 RepID=UPI001C269C3A|nr:hypothetical protein [Burkholderia multivorans]MBU9576478.1 hypothetical protein [Burkholderia multivorans]